FGVLFDEVRDRDRRSHLDTVTQASACAFSSPKRKPLKFSPDPADEIIVAPIMSRRHVSVRSYRGSEGKARDRVPGSTSILGAKGGVNLMRLHLQLHIRF